MTLKAPAPDARDADVSSDAEYKQDAPWSPRELLSLQRIVCGGCSSALKAPPTLAGKSVKCPKCGDLVHVPPLLEHGGDLYRLAGVTVEPRQETSNTASTSESKPPIAKTKKPAGQPKPLSKEVIKARLDEVLAGFNGEFKRPRRGVGYSFLTTASLNSAGVSRDASHRLPRPFDGRRAFGKN
jgi:hypothetical protein